MSAESERGELIAEFGDILHLWNVGDATKRDRISSALADRVNALGFTRRSRAEIQAEDGLDKIADDAATNDGRVIVWAVNELTRAVRGVEAAIQEGGERG